MLNSASRLVCSPFIAQDSNELAKEGTLDSYTIFHGRGGYVPYELHTGSGAHRLHTPPESLLPAIRLCVLAGTAQLTDCVSVHLYTDPESF